MELWQLQQMQGLPLEIKIEKSKLRIREWYEHYDGQINVSFSGGKDSTVLLHLVRSMYPEVPAVFSDTGLEFPEIRDFVKTIPNVTWIRPDMTFRQVIEKYGYPVISKEQSEWCIESAAETRMYFKKNTLVFAQTEKLPASSWRDNGAFFLTRRLRSAAGVATR